MSKPGIAAVSVWTTLQRKRGREDVWPGLAELGRVDFVFLYLVIHDALGCSENLGRLTLIAPGCFQGLYDQYSFIGVDFPSQITE